MENRRYKNERSCIKDKKILKKGKLQGYYITNLYVHPFFLLKIKQTDKNMVLFQN